MSEIPVKQVTSTVIGSDTHIKGEMTFQGSARLLGTFEGRISAQGELQVAEGATCKATVEAGTVIVDGAVEGDLNARDRVQLNAKAKIQGDLVASKLVVAEGASFVGHVTVGPEAGKTAAAKAGDTRARSLAEPKPGEDHHPRTSETAAAGVGSGRTR